MKKILSLLFVFMFICMPVFAENWVKLRTENDKIYYLSQNNNKSGNIVYCKIKQVPLWEGENRGIFSLKIDYGNAVVYTKYTRYNQNWAPVSSSNFPGRRFDQINPNSTFADAIVKIGKQYGLKY